MAFWLVKEEPTHYAFSDLVRDGETDWSGVANPLARRHLAAMRVGDEGLYYHTGREKAIVGRFRVVRAGRGGAIPVRLAAGRPLSVPVPLRALRADARFASFALVRISRLSVLPVPTPLWRAILRMAAARGPAPAQSGPARPRARSRARRVRHRGSP
jgi:predicted RNA-binding protein with PUA-like domain